MTTWKRYLVLCGFMALCTVLPLRVRGDEAPMVPCHTAGGVGQAVPSGHGSPRNFFSSSSPLVLEARCGEDGVVRVTAGAEGTTYVYRYGREKVGNTWKDMSFSGSVRVGAWFVGTANATLTEQLAPGERASFLAYVCQLVKGVWKCGCRDAVCATPYWQRQEVYLPTVDVWPDLAPRAGLHVDMVSEYLVEYGDTVTILGSGFLRTGNDVVWDDGVWVQRDLSSPTGTTLSLRVPRLALGKHRVRVRTGMVLSSESAGVWIAAQNATAPVISSISPPAGTEGDVFTLRGNGFGRVNDLATMFGLLEDLPSPDGTTITFTYAPFGDMPVRFRTATGTPASYTAQVPVMVLNENGMSTHVFLGLKM